MNIYFNYSIDCESPPDGKFGGPSTWEMAEISTRGFVAVMEELGLAAGTTLFVYPDVAIKQRRLFREMAEGGVEIGLHLHGMRYSRLKNPDWLGAMSYREQFEALRMAKDDLEEVTGKLCLGYRACYASANHDTYPVLEQLGFHWSSTSASGSYNPDIHARWAGGWPFPYHPSRTNKLVPGDMKIYEIPLTRGIRTVFEGNPDRPLDMRAETPPEIVGPAGAAFKGVIEENRREMGRRDHPVRAILGASHNTNPYSDRATFQHRNLRWAYQCAVTSCESMNCELIPATFAAIHSEAKRIRAF